MRMKVSPKISFTLWLRFNSDKALIRAVRPLWLKPRQKTERKRKRKSPRLLVSCWDRSVPCSHNFCGKVWILKRLQYVYFITLSLQFETWVSFTVGFATQLRAAISRSPPNSLQRSNLASPGFHRRRNRGERTGRVIHDLSTAVTQLI